MDDRFNTASGWVLFAGIIALGLSYISSKVFDTERPEVMGYAIEVADAGGGADSGPSLAELLAAGDAAAGEKVFAKCSACHSINQGGAQGIGPNLYGILGLPIGKHASGFAYSSALAEKGGNWGFDEMNAWLKNPRGFANGTKMSFAGLGKPEDRANVILYMLANGGGPELPEVVAAPEAADAEEPIDAEMASAQASVEDAAEEGDAALAESE
ncbi:c-type cytochrome [Pontixanthobacter sp.]|uniref:c-type cytochrome n=1 Tax=Pontixanthobacter sp. TaxID=2792078 RepID=UPI003C7E5AB8